MNLVIDFHDGTSVTVHDTDDFGLSPSGMLLCLKHNVLDPSQPNKTIAGFAIPDIKWFHLDDVVIS